MLIDSIYKFIVSTCHIPTSSITTCIFRKSFSWHLYHLVETFIWKCLGSWEETRSWPPLPGGHQLLFRQRMEFLPLLLTSDFSAMLVLQFLGVLEGVMDLDGERLHEYSLLERMAGFLMIFISGAGLEVWFACT